MKQERSRVEEKLSAKLEELFTQNENLKTVI